MILKYKKVINLLYSSSDKCLVEKKLEHKVSVTS